MLRFAWADRNGRCVNALTTNSGQICFAATRVYVQEGIYDKFVDAYINGIKAKTNMQTFDRLVGSFRDTDPGGCGGYSQSTQGRINLTDKQFIIMFIVLI